MMEGSREIPKLFGIALHWQIAIALLLAALVGGIVQMAAPEGVEASATALGSGLVATLDFIGGLFVNALKMIVVPIILASIIVGVANMAGQDAFGRVGGKTLGFYVITGIFAIFTGLVAVNLISPGTVEGAQAMRSALPDATAQLARAEGRGFGDLVGILSRAIPPNIIEAAAETQLLALIFVGAVFGYFMSRLTGKARETLQSFWEGVQEVTIMITMWIMRFAPLGVFALVGETFIVSGFAPLVALGVFFITVLLALAIHFFGWLPLLLRVVGRVNPMAYYRKLLPAQLTAFSTASSSATLPVTLNSAADAGVPPRVTGFVLPLGATVNMDGTALYECVVVIFIAQVMGIDLTIGQQLLVLLLALLTSIGVAGIPAASLVAIVLILPVVGLPVEAIGLVLAVDRILDMCRTAVNVTGDLTVTALVARAEGEELPEVAMQKAG